MKNETIDEGKLFTMKSLEELYKEVMASDELRKEFVESAKSKETVAAWLQKHDCSASADDLSKFLKEKSEGEMEDNDVETVAGGKADSSVVFLSVITAGFYCAIYAVASCADEDRTTRECFQEQER